MWGAKNKKQKARLCVINIICFLQKNHLPHSTVRAAVRAGFINWCVCYFFF